MSYGYWRAWAHYELQLVSIEHGDGEAKLGEHKQEQGGALTHEQWQEGGGATIREQERRGLSLSYSLSMGFNGVGQMAKEGPKTRSWQAWSELGLGGAR